MEAAVGRPTRRRRIRRHQRIQSPPIKAPARPRLVPRLRILRLLIRRLEGQELDLRRPTVGPGHDSRLKLELTTMWEIVWNRHVRRVGVIGLLAMLAYWVAQKEPERVQPAVSPSNVRQNELEGDFVYEQQESVGWVFGRMIGFQGADKPLLPRQSPPFAPLPGPSLPH